MPSDKKVVKFRLPELDIMRGMAVLLMIVEHVNMYFTSENLLEKNTLFKITQSGIGDVAVMFMFIMGMNTVLSKKMTAYTIFKRGWIVYFFSFVFNFIRDVIPAFIGSNAGISAFSHSIYANVDVYHTMFGIDIFQFVGLSLIFIGALRLLKINSYLELTIGIIIAASTLFITKHPTVYTVDNWLNEILVGGWSLNYFPFLSWIIFPITGAYFARLLMKTEDIAYFYKKLMWGSFSVYILGWCLLLYFFPKIDFFGWQDEMNYYTQNFLSNVFFISETLFFIAISYYLCKLKLLPQSVYQFLVFWSKNITSIYIVSWLYISWLTWDVFGWHAISNPILAIATTGLIIMVSHITIKRFPAITTFLHKLF